MSASRSRSRWPGSLSAAAEAAERVVIHYAPRDCVTDVLAAAEAGAPHVQNGGGNVVGELRLGDPEACRAALARASHRVDLRVRNNRLLPHPMEPRAAIGLYDAARETWTLHCRTRRHTTAETSSPKPSSASQKSG